MKVFDIALKDLLRSFRSMFFLMFGLGMPLLMAGIFYFAFGSVGSDEDFDLPQTQVRVVNLDEPMSEYGNFSAGQMLIDFLKAEELTKLLQVTEVADAASARSAVDGQEAGVAVISPADLSAAVFDPQGRASVEVYHDPTLTLGPSIVKGIISQFVDGFAGSKIAANVAHDHLIQQGVAVDASLLQEVAMKYAAWSAALAESGQQVGTDGLITIQSPVGAKERDTNQVAGMVSVIMAGMMVFYAFFTGAASAMSILDEEEKGTLARIFTTPTSQAAILSGKFIAVFALIVVQVAVLMTAASLIFKTDWGAPLPLALVAVSLVVVAACFGIFITSLLKDTKQTGIVYGGVMTVLGMVGVSPVFTASIPNVSSTVKNLPLVVPQGWAMRGLQVVMAGGGLEEVLLPVLVMLALGAIFFMIGVLKFKKRFA